MLNKCHCVYHLVHEFRGHGFCSQTLLLYVFHELDRAFGDHILTHWNFVSIGLSLPNCPRLPSVIPDVASMSTVTFASG